MPDEREPAGPEQEGGAPPGIELPSRLQGGPLQPELAREAGRPPDEIPPERLVPEEARVGEAEEVNDFLMNIGPHHPGTHGVLRLVTRLDGEKVVGLDTRIGYMHRSLEKIAENRTLPADHPLRRPHDRLHHLHAQRLGVLLGRRDASWGSCRRSAPSTCGSSWAR